MDFERDYPQLREAAVKRARNAGAPSAFVEDIADEAMTRLVAQDPAPDEPRAWVRRVVSNLVIDAWRKKPAAGWTSMPTSAPPPGGKPYPAGFAAQPASGLARAHIQLDQALETMRDVLTDVELALLLESAQGQRARQIAEEHGYTEAAVRQIVYVARKKLRDALPGFDLSV